MFRIRSAQEASVVISGAINSHKETWRRIDNIEDYILRSRLPFDEEARKENGLDWAANFNYGKGKSKIEQSVAKNVETVAATLSFLEVFFKKYDKKEHKKKIYSFIDDPYLSNKFSLAISSVFIDTLEQDPNFYYWLSKIEYNAFTFGFCPITRDNFSYLGNANHVRSIAFEDRTKLSKVKSWVLFDTVKAEVLYRTAISLQGKESELINECGQEYHIYKSGWIKEGLNEVLCSPFHKENASEKDNTEGKYDLNPINGAFSWENVEYVISKQGRSLFLSNINNVYIAKIYCFDEDNNFIETYVVTTGDQSLKDIADLTTNNYLLYQKNHGKKEQSQVINIIREYSINSNDFIHELKGAGKIIAEDSLRFDIKKCRLEDKLLIANSPLLTESSAMQGENNKIAVTGGFVMLSEGVNIDPTQLRFDLQPHIASMQIDEANFGRETFHLDPKLDLSTRPTTEEVSQRSNEVNRQRMSKVPIKICDYSILFFNVLIDLVTKEYKDEEINRVQNFFFEEMMKELSNEEITKQDIKDIVKEVSYARLNPVNTDVGAIKEAMTMAESSEARERLMKMYFLAIGFSRRDVNNIIVAQNYGTQLSIASLENASFYNTSEIAFGQDQDHITHLNTHFAKIDRVIQGVSQGEDPVIGFNFLTNCLQNTEKHVEALSTSPFYKKKFKEFLGIQKFFEGKAVQLSGVIKQMKARADQAAAQAQQNGQQISQQPQLTPQERNEIEISNFKAMDKIRRTNDLTKAAMERKNIEFQQKLQLQKGESESRINIAKEIADLKKDIELVKSSTKMATR